MGGGVHLRTWESWSLGAGLLRSPERLLWRLRGECGGWEEAGWSSLWGASSLGPGMQVQIKEGGCGASLSSEAEEAGRGHGPGDGEILQGLSRSPEGISDEGKFVCSPGWFWAPVLRWGNRLFSGSQPSLWHRAECPVSLVIQNWSVCSWRGIFCDQHPCDCALGS